MIVSITPRAVLQIEKYVPAQYGIRIQVTYEGMNCGCSVVFTLSMVHANESESDTVTSDNNVQLYIDETSLSLLDHDMILDYTNNVGYSLSTSQETLAYGLKIER